LNGAQRGIRSGARFNKNRPYAQAWQGLNRYQRGIRSGARFNKNRSNAQRWHGARNAGICQPWSLVLAERDHAFADLGLAPEGDAADRRD
jgi:hypothetical protein